MKPCRNAVFHSAKRCASKIDRRRDAQWRRHKPETGARVLHSGQLLKRSPEMTEPTIAELSTQIQSTQTAINFVWTLVAGFLVMFMQAGFALVETGLTRAKNVAHTM